MRRDVIFDVESVGLHGEGFAVGYVVLLDGAQVSEAWAYCNPDRARGTASGRKWVEENCLWLAMSEDPLARPWPLPTRLATPREVRDWFWSRWRDEANSGASLWGDVIWPVESRFLISCVEDAREARSSCRCGGSCSRCKSDPTTPREFEGPYPLHDVAMLVRATSGAPRPVSFTALASEGPALHHPLVDARKSATIVTEWWKACLR